MKKAFRSLSFIAILLLFSSCIPSNVIIEKEETVDQSWANVESAYQRRLDLIDNLVATVQQAAEFEKKTFIDLAKARAGVIEPTQEMLENKELLAEFYKNQKALQSQAKAMFNISVESYPNLKATDAFRDFQAQLEGTENRINAARNSFNGSVKEYNAYIQKIPGSWFADGREKKEYFSADKGAEKATNVRDAFNK